MNIFKNNKIVNEYNDLEQAIFLFGFQNKYVGELTKEDCSIIFDLLIELKNYRENNKGNSTMDIFQDGSKHRVKGNSERECAEKMKCHSTEEPVRVERYRTTMEKVTG